MNCQDLIGRKNYLQSAYVVRDCKSHDKRFEVPIKMHSCYIDERLSTKAHYYLFRSKPLKFFIKIYYFLFFGAVKIREEIEK